MSYAERELVEVLSAAPYLICADAIHAMRSMPDRSIDAVVCDPPYGTTRNPWDAVIPFEPMWQELRRVVKPGGAIVFTASQPFSSALVMSNPAWFRHEWVWHKNKATGHLNAKRAPMRAHELVLVFCDRAPLYQPQMTHGHKPGNYAKRGKQSACYGQAKATEYGGSTSRYPRSVLEFPVVNNDDPAKVHPTQKPAALMSYLLNTYTLPGNRVLDFAMGSGTTGEACADTGREFVGIDIDPEIFDKAQKRLGAPA